MLYDAIVARKEKVSVIGLGYVGMPLAVAFAKHVDVIGFDINPEKIALYKAGKDPTKEVGDEAVKNSDVLFTGDPMLLREAKFHIIAVPTPVRDDHTPNLLPVESASKMLGANLTRGSIVIYESTVFPGVTEDICKPILERESGLVCGVDFKIGYSPERINPGDKVNTLETIVKVVSGMDSETLEEAAKMYELIITAGVYRAESIKVAEASKVIENSQRDVNIAFMNELSMMFNKIGVDTTAVLEAAGTKWNFLKFTPGLVGGHCIGVDPYYLTYKAEQMGYHSQLISAGRRINDDMGRFITENVVKRMIAADIRIKGSKIAVLGITFKENCPDIRNTRVVDIIYELSEYGVDITVCDPWADVVEVKHEYGLDLKPMADIKEMDAVILAVAHDEFKQLSKYEIDAMFKPGETSARVIADIKSVLDKEQYADYSLWRL